MTGSCAVTARAPEFENHGFIVAVCLSFAAKKPMDIAGTSLKQARLVHRISHGPTGHCRRILYPGGYRPKSNRNRDLHLVQICDVVNE